MRTLERLTVTGYKSIRELRDFELGDLNVLIGANGAGKSNFLSVFKMLKALANNRLQLFIGQNRWADYLLHFGVKYTEEIQVGLTLGAAIEIFEYEFRLKPVISSEMALHDERCANRLRREETLNWTDMGSGQRKQNFLFKTLGGKERF